jgi:transcriptional regulator GlxA family with amidase domain
MERTNVGILLFDDVEVLDFAGPFEVFSRARTVPGPESRRSEESAPFEVFTVARTTAPVRAVGGLAVLPRYGFADAPRIDLLLVPGGWGTRALLADGETLAWLAERAAAARLVTSVCTGSLVLGKLGLLDGRRATTHWSALDLLAALSPATAVERDRRWVEDGVVTSAGVAAGIDMAFHLVARLCGDEVARETARYIEYPWVPDEPQGEGAAAGGAT